MNGSPTGLNRSPAQRALHLGLGIASVCFSAAFFCASATAGPLDEFSALELQMEIAGEEFFDAIDNADDPTKLPEDRRPGILKRMEDLVKSTAGKPEAARIAVNTFVWSLDIKAEQGLKRFQVLANQFANASELGDALDTLLFYYEASSTPQAWVGELRKLSDATKIEQNKAGAQFAAGQIYLNLKQLKDAKRAFEVVRKVSAASAYATAAKGFIFEIEHLQIGMIAPDFKAKALDGKEVSLKSLRGKVVLLSFWASW